MDHLRARGVETAAVLEVGMQGASDLAILKAAAEGGYAILTQDLDFGRIFVERAPDVQIVVLRSRDPRPVALRDLVDLMLKRIDLDAPQHRAALIVVGERGYRVRHRPA